MPQTGEKKIALLKKNVLNSIVLFIKVLFSMIFDVIFKRVSESIKFFYA